ncbi:GSCOCG00012104001-RA-CDS, partial [Cotesia congregata]
MECMDKIGPEKRGERKSAEKYPRGGSCLLEAPILNSEIASTLNESALKRDKYFCNTQKLAGSSLSALAPVINLLLEKDKIDSKEILGNIWDAARIQAELHHSQSIARRAYILPGPRKQVASSLEERQIDTQLFGDKLGEKIKEIKSMDKLTHDLKVQPQKKSLTSIGCPKTTSKAFQPEQTQSDSESELSSSSIEQQQQHQQITNPLGREQEQVKLVGRLKHFLKAWEQITPDKFIRQCITGHKINFKEIPYQTHPTGGKIWSSQEASDIQKELDRLLTIGAIEKCSDTVDQFLSSYFLREKPDGSKR